jgi:GNAT superfamily N-acetyltransferase
MSGGIEKSRVAVADYDDPAQGQALVDLLDAYARDPMGGGQPLGPLARSQLVSGLRACKGAFSVLAWSDGADGSVCGLANCLEGFSTFAGRPLINVHDIFVLPDQRGQGIAGQMLALVEAVARKRGACKLTLEVLQGNAGAANVYQRAGFANYALDPAFGSALLMQKYL